MSEHISEFNYIPFSFFTFPYLSNLELNKVHRCEVRIYKCFIQVLMMHIYSKEAKYILQMNFLVWGPFTNDFAGGLSGGDIKWQWRGRGSVKVSHNANA